VSSSSASGHSKLNRWDGYALAGFLLFLMVFFSGVLAQSSQRCLGQENQDASNQFYGWRAYGFGEVRAGRFPLWNPYEFLGMTFVASLQSAMFYPTNWLCAVLPLCRAINFGIILNLFLSGLFTYLWARRFGLRCVGAIVAAATYVFGAPQILRIYVGHWSFLAPMPWIPCILLCVEMLVCGGSVPLAIVLGAVAVAMEWFGGNPQYAFYGGIAAVLYLAGRLWQRRELGARGALRAVGAFALIYLFGSALAGVQLMPALELFSLSARRGQLTYAWVKQYSFVPEGLLSFLVPDIFGNDVGMRYWGRWNLWETSPYVGVIAFGLAIIAVLRGARGRAFLPGCIALLCLLFALTGDALFFGVIPGFNLFRAEGRWLCPMSLFFGLVAGLGADAITARAPEETESASVDAEKNLARADRPALSRPNGPALSLSKGAGTWILASLAAALLLAGAALILDLRFGQAAWERFMIFILRIAPRERVYMREWTPWGEFRPIAMHAAGLSMLRSGLFLGALAGLVRLRRRPSIKPAWVAEALLLLVAVDAWTFGQRYMVTFDPRKGDLSPGAVEFLAEQRQPFRYWRGGCGSLPPCEGMTHHFACIEGVQPNVPARFRDVFWSLQGDYIYQQALDRKFTSYFVYDPRPALLMFNLRYVVAYPSCRQLQIEGIRTVYQDPQIRTDELPDFWPRAWLVHRYEVKHDSQEVLALLPQFNYAKVALFEEDPHCALGEPSAPEAVPDIVRCEPARIDIKLQATAPALLVLSDLFYPGWEAAVDGRPAEILRANYLMRAVAIPQGAHEVRFLYRPASFRAGVAASAAGSLAVALLISWHLWTRRRRGNA
jgi:hypothetical protein